MTKSSTSVVPILMPEAGNSMEEGTVLEWRVKVGDVVAQGDILCEIETDKASIEYESPCAGRLARIVVDDGDTAPVKQPIGYFADDPSSVDDFLQDSPQVSSQSTNRPEPPTASTTTPSAKRPASASATPDIAARPRVSPAARRVARERGIDVADAAPGSGPGGRVLSTDLPRSSGGQTSVPSKMRRVIGERLQLSKQTIPHFYTRTTVRADQLYAKFKQLQSENGASVNDLIVAACGKALMDFPALRSQYQADQIVEHPGANIGIAVGLDEGLVVPVLRAVQNMTIDQLAAETKRIVADARRGIVAAPGEGVMTISNLGMFGVEEFAAIINPPEAAILAVGAIREEAVVENGWIRPGRVMTITLSADHRLVDGVTAARFLGELRQQLESPDSLVE